MLQFIVNLLTPIFSSMGVSPVDVQQYVETCSGYIYGILAALLVMAAVLVAAHWLVKKGSRHVVRWGAAVAGVLVITLLANLVCFGPLYGNLSIMLNSTGRVSEESAAVSKQVAERIGEEGMVLVKNEDNALPLAENSSINVFGWASTNPIFGGTGSGSSDSSNAIGILESLSQAGFTTNSELTKLYTDYQESRSSKEMTNVGFTDWTLPEPTVEAYTDGVMAQAKEFSDTAMIVISRSGGEGQDLPRDMNAVIHGTIDIRDEVANGNENYNYYNFVYTNNGDYDDFDAGESYLQLSNTEEAMVEKVCGEFDKVIVVINANNTMELGWVDEYPSIKSVILAPGTGNDGMLGLGRILDGEVNPSGRTVDTYPYAKEDEPSYNISGGFTFTNVADLQASTTAADPAFMGAFGWVAYNEGIYTGYKWYETAADEGAINYGNIVQYPFGYGLSYTSFTQEMSNFSASGDNITFDVTVTNTGSRAGRDVVEVYFTPPYTNGGIEKASVNLIDFGKTSVLEAGGSEMISFSIPKEEMASYDSSAIKTANGGYILEAGTYTVSIRSDSHTVIASEDFTVEQDIDYSTTGRASDKITATNRFQDYSAGSFEYLSRADGFANAGTALAVPTEDKNLMDDTTKALIAPKLVGAYDPTAYDDPSLPMPVTGADNGLALADFRDVPYDDPSWEQLIDQVKVEEMTQLVNLAGFQTIEVKSIGKRATMDADGPSGVNNWVTGVYGTSMPTATMVAMTWSKECAAEFGACVGQEYADCEIYGWYGPAMNIHRTAFNGRNFEYYSEDGVLSAKIASAVVSACGEKGVYAYLKHFVVNDQETNRCTALQTYLTEQTLREIYMKPFEECVKNYDYSQDPLAVMSSFVFIGHKYCGANPDLLQTVLRDEWGFQGMVLTDWDGSYGYQNTDDCIRNCNDAMLGFYSYPYSNDITDTDAPSCVAALKQATKNICFTVVHSGAYAPGQSSGGITPMTAMFIGIDAAVVIVCAAAMAIVLVRWNKKRKA